MENQHRKIGGYRDLSQLEIDLMNEIKAIEAQICASESFESIRLRYCQALHKAGFEGLEMAQKINGFESNWAQAHTFLQTGFMWAVRAIAQPQPIKPAAKVVWHTVDSVTTSEEMLKDEAQLLVESHEGRHLMTGAGLRAATSEHVEGGSPYKRFLFLDTLPA